MSLFDRGARVVSVGGAFGSRALVEMRTELAEELFEMPLSGCAPSEVVDAVREDVDALGKRAPGGLSATALALARELENPFASATAKSMCAKALMEAMDRIRALAPPKREADKIDELADRRVARRAGGSASADSSRT